MTAPRPITPLPPGPTAADYAAAAAWLRRWAHPLIVTHERPDGDAIGAAAGLGVVLRAAGIPARVFLEAEVAESYRPFLPPETQLGGAVDPASVDALICVDCATAPRLALPCGWRADALPVPVANLDHHVDNPRYGQLNLVDPARAATAELLVQLCQAGALAVPPAADLFLVGVVMDTGGFRFSNTRRPTFEAAGWLLEQGAEFERVMHYLFFDVPPARLRLQGQVLEGMRYAYDGRLAYFFITPELLASCGADVRDVEEIIDVARAIRGVILVCRLQLVEQGVRFSLRSSDARYPAITIAHQLGGGGHPAAAGALVKGIALPAAEALLLQHTKDLFDAR